ncbi:MAG: hypothetical protein U0X40_10165 [Ferruginibacter sp.]
MAACNFSIEFSGTAEDITQKARQIVEVKGGNFSGDTSTGKFDISMLGAGIAGSYTVNGNALDITIEEKPFFVPCDTVENYFRYKLSQ